MSETRFELFKDLFSEIGNQSMVTDEEIQIWSELKNFYMHLLQQIDDQQLEVDFLKNQNKQLKSYMNQQTKEFDLVDTCKWELEATLRQLQTEHGEAKQCIKSLKTLVVKLESTVASLSSELSDAKAMIEKEKPCIPDVDRDGIDCKQHGAERKGEEEEEEEEEVVANDLEVANMQLRAELADADRTLGEESKEKAELANRLEAVESENDLLRQRISTMANGENERLDNLHLKVENLSRENAHLEQLLEETLIKSNETLLNASSIPFMDDDLSLIELERCAKFANKRQLESSVDSCYEAITVDNVNPEEPPVVVEQHHYHNETKITYNIKPTVNVHIKCTSTPNKDSSTKGAKCTSTPSTDNRTKEAAPVVGETTAPKTEAVVAAVKQTAEVATQTENRYLCVITELSEADERQAGKQRLGKTLCSLVRRYLLGKKKKSDAVTGVVNDTFRVETRHFVLECADPTLKGHRKEILSEMRRLRTRSDAAEFADGIAGCRPRAASMNSKTLLRDSAPRRSAFFKRSIFSVDQPRRETIHTEV